MSTLKKPENLYNQEESIENGKITNSQVAKSAIHTNNTNEVANVAIVATSTNEENISKQSKIKDVEILNEHSLEEIDVSQFIPDFVYRNLPTFLKDSCNIFLDKHERDVYLTGALGILGGCFHNLYAFNDVDNKRVNVNLMGLIIAGAGSGKNSLNYSKKLAEAVASHFALNQLNPAANQQCKLFILLISAVLD